MKSIRLSLLLYFLVLLAVALGAVSGLAYQYSERILQAKEESRAQLLKAQHKDLCNRASDRLDRALGQQARVLASHVQVHYSWNRMHSQMATVALGSAIDAKGALVAPFWLAPLLPPNPSYPPIPWADYLVRMSYREVLFDEEQLAHNPDLPAPEYFQINTDWGPSRRSRSMGERSFPFDPAVLQKMQLSDTAQADEIDLEPDVHVRRVLLKAPITKTSFPWWGRPRPHERSASTPGQRGERHDSSEGPRPGSGDRPRTGPNQRPPSPPPERQISSPTILIQYAVETTRLKAHLADVQAELDDGLANLRAESIATLASLRYRLLFISLATFAATVVGGFWLVRVGLAPLKRLSEAVGQVSAKDFRLPLEESRLPGELRPIAERLTQTLDLLKRAFAREKQAAADISHELRTPLAALLTTIEVALRKQRAPEEYRELLSDCHATGQQMSQLVERLLALARLDAGVDTLRPRVIDVANLAEQCANLVRPLAAARDLTLRVHRNGEVPLNTDPDKFREILTNLLHNAIEYNQPRGRVDLTVERQDGHLRLEVRDTGIGIAPEAREHIFERFYRADSSRHAEGLHAGLGLSIVKGYVDLMGGTITVESTVGKGSVFLLQLPA